MCCFGAYHKTAYPGSAYTPAYSPACDCDLPDDTHDSGFCEKMIACSDDTHDSGFCEKMIAGNDDDGT